LEHRRRFYHWEVLLFENYYPGLRRSSLTRLQYIGITIPFFLLSFIIIVDLSKPRGLILTLDSCFIQEFSARISSSRFSLCMQLLPVYRETKLLYNNALVPTCTCPSSIVVLLTQLRCCLPHFCALVSAGLNALHLHLSIRH
jgi:hypothetical protein